ncbi:hypothetical protein U1Q18_013001 [Sarracenia purpurea var. burkii]
MWRLPMVEVMNGGGSDGCAKLVGSTNGFEEVVTMMGDCQMPTQMKSLLEHEMKYSA